MRILSIILMILAFLVAAGMGFAIGNKNLMSEDAAAAAAMIEQLGDSELGAQLSGYRTSGIGGFVVGLMSLVMVIVTFMKKTKIINIVAGATAAIAVLFILMCPGFETGEYAAASPQKQAMVYGVAAILVALFGFLAEKKRAA